MGFICDFSRRAGIDSRIWSPEGDPTAGTGHLEAAESSEDPPHFRFISLGIFFVRPVKPSR